MDNIIILIDKLIPRGGEVPDSIHVSLEEYLSRLSNFNRKLVGIRYRIEVWEKLCKEHDEDFNRMVNSKDPLKNADLKITQFNYTSRDLRIENEFEMILYSISSALSSLTRVIGSFLKGSIDIHSHSNLSRTLSKYPDFEKNNLLVIGAYNLWFKELTNRRDYATHYIALSITSSIKHSRSESNTIEKNVSRIQIPKNPSKYFSLWEDELPTIGGSHSIKMLGSDGTEINELKDSENTTIVRRELPLEKQPELIDGEKYIQRLNKYFLKYIENILNSFVSKI